MKKTVLAAITAFIVFLPVSVQAQTQVQVSAACGTTTCNVGFVRDDGEAFASGTQFWGVAPPVVVTGNNIGIDQVNDRALLFESVFQIGAAGNTPTNGGSSNFRLQLATAAANANYRFTIDGTAMATVTLAVHHGTGIELVGDVNADNQLVFTRATVGGAVMPFMPVVVDMAEVMRLQGELDTAEAALATAEAALADAPTDADVMAAEEARDAALARVMQLETQLAAAGETPAETPTAGTPVAPAETPAAAAPARRSSSNSGSGNAVAVAVVGLGYLVTRHLNLQLQTGYAPLDNFANNASMFMAPTSDNSYRVQLGYKMQNGWQTTLQYDEGNLNESSDLFKPKTSERIMWQLEIPLK